jgi:hypothetical protein
MKSLNVYRGDRKIKDSELSVGKQSLNLTNSTPRRKVLLEKLTVTQLVKKFIAFYGTRRIIIVFTRDPPPPLFTILSQMNPVHNLPPYFPRFIPTLSSYLRLGFPGGLFSSGFLIKIS